jgi:hypothetical protein
MTTNIFVSVGRASTPEQEKFVSAIEQYLRDNGFEPRIVGRTVFSSLQPLKFIEQLMHECSGTIVIAFERVYIHEGIEKRGGENEKVMRDAKLPTVWNQIEAAMAYVLGHPLLVIIENGIRSEGLLETGYDWYMQSVKLDASTLNTREFGGVFGDWKNRVESFQKAQIKKPQTIETEKLSISQLLGSLKLAQLWTVIIALIGAISAIATAAFKLGTIFAGQP